MRESSKTRLMQPTRKKEAAEEGRGAAPKHSRSTEASGALSREPEALHGCLSGKESAAFGLRASRSFPPPFHPLPSSPSSQCSQATSRSLLYTSTLILLHS